MTDVEAVSPGSYRLEVTLRDAKPVAYPVSVIEGETTVVEVR